MVCIRYYYNGKSYAYYVQTNARGDIEAMYGGDGIVRVRYIYDSWGNTLSVQDANGKEITDPNHMGNLNPMRYRGYYFDTETGLYYLQSRYYDPQTCRFVNADTTDILQAKGDLYDKNLFAYCDNNPVARKDTDGEFWVQLGATFAGGLISAGIEIGSQLASGKSLNDINWNSVIIEGISGAATGLIMSIGIPSTVVVQGRAAINFATSVAHSINDGDGFTETVVKATTSSALTLIAGNSKPLGQQLTRGRHAKLSKAGDLIRELTYTPKHMVRTSIGSAISSRAIRGIGRAITKHIFTLN